MTLHDLLNGVEYQGSVKDCEVTAIVSDSRQMEPGCLFFCISGVRFDGHDFAQQALDAGAAAIVCERDLGLPQQLLVANTHAAYGIASANYYGNPAAKLTLLGVTGTNGKTTTTTMIKHILESAGHRVGLVGTIQNEIADMTLPAKYTTPDPMQLHAIFARMVEAGCKYVIMEVSSHALQQERVAGCHFACAAFTNLTQDHLDYHGNMEGYFAAKAKLFSICGTAILNLDDPYGLRLLKQCSCPSMTFSCENDQADLTARNIRTTAQGTNFALLKGSTLSRVSLSMPGRFSVANALAAAGVCLGAGLSLPEVVEGLNSCGGVAGRVEILPTQTPYTVIRDYAHSPDSLEKVLHTIREFAPGRIVSLFGCAGNRDRTKRPLMAEIVSRLSDFCILTSDNPRDEDPARIVQDALPGLQMHPTPHKVIVDRYQAIEWALRNSRPNDILLLAGKGHEDYQVLDYGTIYFDERTIVMELLQKMRSEQNDAAE
jgi:UDP-N-acetylmuramyl-tripeptide synthetase